MGLPNTANRVCLVVASLITVRTLSFSTPPSQLVHGGVVLGVRVGELGFAGLQVDRDEEQPIAVSRVDGCINGLVARGTDRADRKTRVLVGVVGIVVFELCLRSEH